MALGIIEVLERHGSINQDELVQVFARRYWSNPNRGYGPTPPRIFDAIRNGVPWQEAVLSVGLPQLGWLDRLGIRLGLITPPPPQPGGSAGNGAAMRVAPLGAYFAEDVAGLVAEAEASAAVTHAHPDGRAGAIAVALAAAWAWRSHAGQQAHTREGMIDHVLEHTPDSPTRQLLTRARELPADTDPDTAAGELGNGSPILSVETVPFCVWCATRHLDNFEDALWAAVGVGGDIDTNCAIVGGIVALGTGRESIPAEWLARREALQFARAEQ
jgi:ADP-ribosylglycohydrolase